MKTLSIFLILIAIFISSCESLRASAVIDLNIVDSEASLANEQTVEEVEVVRELQGKFLALVPIRFLVRAVANANGFVEVEYPWYSVLTVDNEDEIKTRVRVAVDNAISASYRGSVRAEGKSLYPSFTSAQEELIREAIEKALESTAYPQ